MKKWGTHFACALLVLFLGIAHAALPPNKACYCTPSDVCWPKKADWERLNQKVHGRLQKIHSFLTPCEKNSLSDECQNALKQASSAFFLESIPSGDQHTGWYKAWTSLPSTYAVVVQNSRDIAAAVNFARDNHLKLVIKGTGHDDLGRSNAPNSLLVWTHKMRDITLHKKFVPQGCPKSTTPVPAMTAQAGTRWIEAYKKVSVDNHRYVQGGGCTSVGVAGGFMQGGGYGAFSKQFGTGAASMLQAEVVTADGKTITANACQHQDLFWALQGGGGGTFGVVSNVTLKTYDLPEYFGSINGEIKANNSADFKVLIRAFIRFYHNKLNTPHWGNRIAITSQKSITFSVMSQGYNQAQLNAIWTPFLKHFQETPKRYHTNVSVRAFLATEYWNVAHYKNRPNSVILDKQKTEPTGLFVWKGDQAEVSMYLTYFTSRYLPFSLFEQKNENRLLNALYDASRFADVQIHFHKGLSGASKEAINQTQLTSMNPRAFDAMGLIIIAGGEQDAFPNIKGHKPNMLKAKKDAENAKKAMQILQKITPNAGSYANEADYFEPNWQETFWGKNYATLLTIKNKYDPAHFFSCHHCVGSELDKTKQCVKNT